MQNLTRRDFLKLAATSLGGLALSATRMPTLGRLRASPQGKTNIIILVLDALSARHLSVYDYPRRTTPNLERFAQHSVVYHSHYSGGNFTSPGTASLLTGLLPWGHRAINNDSLIKRDFRNNNIFRLIGSQYYRVGFSQNLWADLLLRQFHDDLDMHVSPRRFSLSGGATTPSRLFPKDSAIAYYALDTFPFTSRQVEKSYPGSLMWGALDLLRGKPSVATSSYPHGLPFNGFVNYEHASVVDGVRQLIEESTKQSKPVFGYFHLFSPHFPYAPRQEYSGMFPPLKAPNLKRHPLSLMSKSQREARDGCDHYDEFIADLDAELGKFIVYLEDSGILETSWVVITSDHGELFERGEIGHGSALLFNPVIQIPLLISSPSQTTRRDVFTPTSNTDILSTILNMAGRPPIDSSDGQVLPGIGGDETVERSIFSMVAKNNYANAPFQTATISLIKGENKLIHYLGYPEYTNRFEMYDLADDPIEKKDLYPRQPSELAQMKQELLDSLADADRPYQR
jgi:arylsulfatase